jgi:hypothetical protein
VRLRVGSLVSGGVVATCALAMLPASASADVITPPGACVASGHWVGAGFTKSSPQYDQSSVISVPRKDTVDWQGSVHGAPLGYIGPTRPIDGAVQLEVPLGIKVTIWHWDGHSSRYSNAGQESYDLPTALVGVKLKLSGYEKDSGSTVCSRPPTPSVGAPSACLSSFSAG